MVQMRAFNGIGQRWRIFHSLEELPLCCCIFLLPEYLKLHSSLLCTRYALNVKAVITHYSQRNTKPTSRAAAGEIVPVVFLCYIGAGCVVLTGLAPTSIEFFTQGTLILILAVTEKSCLKTNRMRSSQWIFKDYVFIEYSTEQRWFCRFPAHNNSSCHRYINCI